MTMSNKKTLGNYGENLIVDFLSSIGCSSVSLSEDQYDQHKDLTFFVDGEIHKAEVKTKTIIEKYQAFALERNQWKKIDNCQHVYFVSIPRFPYDVIAIYEVSDKNAFFIVDNFAGKNEQTRMYPLDKLSRIKTIRDPKKCRELYDLSFSNYKGFNYV